MKSLLLKLSIATCGLCLAAVLGHPAQQQSNAVPASYARMMPMDGNPLPLCPPVCAPRPTPKKPNTHAIAE